MTENIKSLTCKIACVAPLMLCALLSFETQASGPRETLECETTHPQVLYDEADAVVLARSIAGGHYEVIHFWKTSLPGLLHVSTNPPSAGGYQNDKGSLHLLYLHEKDGKFWTSACSGNLMIPEFNPHLSWHDQDDLYAMREKFNSRLQWLDKMSECACPNRSVEDRENEADIVGWMFVSGVTQKEGRKYAELKIYNNRKRLPQGSAMPDVLTVQTDDGKGCGYPIQEYPYPPRKTEFHFHDSYRGYLLYLRRDKKGEFLTDFCSGNLSPSEYLIRNLRNDLERSRWWPYKQNFKETKN